MDRSSGRVWAWMTVILAAAAAARLWYVLELPGQGTDLLGSDMKAYDDSAWQMARGLPVTALGLGFLALAGVTAAEATQVVGALLLLGLVAAPA